MRAAGSWRIVEQIPDFLSRPEGDGLLSRIPKIPGRGRHAESPPTFSMAPTHTAPERLEIGGSHGATVARVGKESVLLSFLRVLWRILAALSAWYFLRRPLESRAHGADINAGVGTSLDKVATQRQPMMPTQLVRVP